ncbi:MAG: arginine N-succinyltransferase [Oligoflexia bacterium]|nr:arginine N-succinyltransferase [Oligoflexia bacterium]
MIVLREIQENDLDALERFAQIPGFINLPNDKDLLREKIQASIASFKSEVKTDGSVKTDGKYIFVAENLENHRVLGTSMIAAQHGTTESPHFYFEVGNEEKLSQTINTGFIHGTLKLKYDTNGPSEIGGLVLDPEYRNSEARVGRQISFVRFLYLGLNRNRFKRKILAELLPPLNKKGQSPLWEAIGRRFTNMDYWEADQLCQKSKEFIFSLFPSGKIYTTFLPAEARNAIGRVGKDTEPVLHMLKKIGFSYKNQVDPFDGGPHLWANVDDLLPLKKLGTYALTPSAKSETTDAGLVTSAKRPTRGGFRAIAAQAAIKDGKITLSDVSDEELHEALGLSPGDSVMFMPYY